MEKFIPYEKLSKKEKRKIDQARRQTWGELNPVTRKPENSRAYNRRKSQNWKRELLLTCSRLFYFSQFAASAFADRFEKEFLKYAEPAATRESQPYKEM